MSQRIKFSDKLKIGSLSRNNLSKAMCKNPSRIFKTGSDSVILEDAKDEAKDRLAYMCGVILDRLVSSVKLKIRNSWDDEEGKLTESWLNDLLNVNKEIVKYKKKINRQRKRLRDACKVFNISKVKIKALANKSEMLINIGYNLRKEMEYNHVKESQRERVSNKIEEN